MKTKSSPPFIFLKNNRAISNILAVVLLILITLVIGGLFFIFGRTMFSSLSTSHDFEILDANILLDSSGKATLQITVKNTGNTKITMSGGTVVLGTQSDSLTWNQALDAGQVVGKTFGLAQSYIVGQKVIVKISATYDTTNTIEKMTQVVVQG
jgi:flagellin-like protein